MIELSAAQVDRLNWFGLKKMLAAVLGSPLVNPLVRALPAKVGRRLPLSLRHVDYEGVKLLDPRKDIIARDIYWNALDAAERCKLRFVAAAAKDYATFLDIGAYAGLFALIAARNNPELIAVAYEIVPENFMLTVRNILENDLADRVEAKLCGIGRNGAVRLPLSMNAASNLTSVSLGSAFGEGTTIPVHTLDRETKGLPGPFLVKIDVEGFEAQVFRSGAAFIRRERPTIICEILPSDELPALPPDYRTFTFEDKLVERPLGPTQKPVDWLFVSDHAPINPW